MSALVQAAVHSGDLTILFVILAFLAFCGAVWCAINNQFVAAAAAIIGVIILVVAG